MLLRRALLSAIVSLAAVACAPVARPPETVRGTLGPDPARRVAVKPRTPARLVPIDVAESHGLGVEPGGGARSIAAGIRVVSLLGGAVVASDDRLPGSRWDALALPDRLGGGFLFKIEDRSIWRAEKWLGRARAIYTSSTAITRIVPGLDRIYVLAGGWHAFDGSTGEPKALGPWPASPTVSAYAAADGWRAIAIADLRGAVTTNDAGATWRALSLPIEPRDVELRGDALEVKGSELGRADVAYEVRPDGQILRASAVQSSPPGTVIPSAQGEPAGSLGAHALVAAVDDGWPLEDGTALVARDGALIRVRLDDGAIVETAADAFALRPSRCHPMPMGGPGEIGFLCGEPRGATVLYAFDAARGAMVELRRFDAPRAVLSSGNGAIAVHGACDPHQSAFGDVDPEAHHYCIRARDGAWREIRVEGGIGRERIAVLADGRFVVLSPPLRGVDAGSLTVVDGEHARTVPIAISGVGDDVARVLAVGVWLDGVEERRAGVLGGWIEAAGTMLGFELKLDGSASFGELVRGETMLPMVSGRYGLGWSATHGGFETTNGGMTWTPAALPEPIKPLREVASRACGPVGCSAAGWLRVGWGADPSADAPPLRPRPLLPRPSPWLALDCAPGEAPARTGAGDFLGAPPAAATTKDTRLLGYETSDTLERTLRTGPLARVFAWGPKAGEWDRDARWVVRWAWPFGSGSDVRSSASAPAPFILLDAAKGAGPLSAPTSFLSLALASGDDPSHALLVARRSPRAAQALFELEAERAPVEIRRGDGEPLGELESAVRASGRWYLATTSRQATRIESIVWQVDGAIARELARIPRASAPDGRVSTGRLAVRSDGRALGLLVDGQPLGDRAGPTRWVVAIDLDTGSVGDAELLGPFELSAQRAIAVCTNDDGGFALDVGLSGDNAFPLTISAAGGPPLTLAGAIARVRFAPSRVCIERLSGSLGAALGKMTRGPAWSPPLASITVTVTDGSEGNPRRVFRCGVR